MERNCDSNTSRNWYAWNNPLKIGKRTGRIENKRTSGNHPDNSIIKIGQNTDKSPRDSRRFQ